VLFDPTLPIEDSKATVEGLGIALARSIDVAGRFANVGVAVPVIHGHIEGRLSGAFQETSRLGQGDIGARFGINLYGAPAVTRQQFGTYRWTTLVGLSLAVGIPAGQYDPARLINISTHRWVVKSEMGFTRKRRRWTFEWDVGGTVFTPNTNYMNGGTRAQAPIASTQGHLTYTVRPGLWVAADGNFWRGGRTTTNGIASAVQQTNSRLGVTLAVPLGRQQVRIAYSDGAYTRVGGDFKTVGVSYSYVWAKTP